MSDDLISRQAAIDAYLETVEPIAVQEWDGEISACARDRDILEMLENLPSVQQKTAYWIDVSGDVPIYNAGGFTEKRKIGVKCSNCQRLNTWCEFDYCPHCGAKMEGKRNETKRP